MYITVDKNLLNLSTHFFKMYDVLYVIKKQKYNLEMCFVLNIISEYKIRTDPCIFYYSIAKKKQGPLILKKKMFLEI